MISEEILDIYFSNFQMGIIFLKQDYNTTMPTPQSGVHTHGISYS